MHLMTRVWLVVAVAALAAVGGWAAPAEFSWKDAGIGAPPAGGTHTWDKTTLTVTGAGAGLNAKGGDGLQYVFLAHPAGDFEISARLAGITGDGDGTAGILVRPDATPLGAMTAFYFHNKDNGLSWMSRQPGAGARTRGGVIGLAQPAPLWLRLVRLGKSFGVYKSRDGKLWSMIGNTGGGAIALDGAFMLGFFVVHPGTTPVTATFDNIHIGPAQMHYKTGWVGNTFGCRDYDNHVSNALSALWVAADGTCYTSSYWDEAGQPVTSYRDGKVLHGLPIGTPQTAEGGITGDGKHLYVATVDRITELDPAAPDYAPRAIHLTVSLLDTKTGNAVVSGLASDGHELFVSDARDNRIRVVSLTPTATLQTAEAANDGVALAPARVIVPEDDPKYAPDVVYQSQRVGEGYRYTLPGFTAGAAYTVRGHFAEFVKRPDNCDPRNRLISACGQELNVAALAGGVLKALVKDFPGIKADDQGNVIVHFGAYGGPGLCGLEVLDAAGKRLFAVNCGGPAVGDFKGESEELVDRGFAFARPGPMTVDKRGNLWIIQRGNDSPMGGGVSARYPAAIKCYKTDGTFTGRAITDVVNPRGLGYDAAKDHLLVAENGPDLNVRSYAGLDTTPTLAGTFGVKGGIYAGAHPGQVMDPAAGGAARFAGLAGVGVDAKGNLYVGGGFQGTDLRMFTPDGKLGWMLNSLMFCNTYDVDPASDGADLYGTYNHVKLDLTKSVPGTEQTYAGYNWDLRNYGDPLNQGGSQSIVRRLGADKRLVMYISGQGIVGDVNLFRYDGELAIPCGRIGDSGTTFWIDANGNGKIDDGEKTTMASGIGWVTSLVVDSRGDIWATVTSTGGSFMRHFPFKGFNAAGVPLYSGVKGDGYVDVPYPEEGGTMNGWGMASRMDYDADRDILVACFPAAPRKGEGDTTPPQYYLARYDHWSKGNRTNTWKVKAFRPETDPDHFMYETHLYPYSGYEGLALAGDYIFFAYLFGEVHAFDLKTGKLAENLAMGPEVEGSSAWEDAAMGLRAFKRKNGEYLIFTENSGWGGKNNFFRWKP